MRGRRRLDREPGDRAAHRSDNRDSAAHEIGSQGRKPLILIFCPAILNRDVLILDVSSLSQTSGKACKISCGFGSTGC